MQLESGTAACMTRGIKILLEAMSLNPKNLIGVGVDNATVNTGVHAGVYELMKKEFDLPNLIMIRCVCHSIQLAISKAVEKKLPSGVEFLVRETYSWFSKSSKRQLSYKKLYDIFSDDNPLQMTRVSDTRWLSISPAVNRILDQWEPLKIHFELSMLSEKCKSAEYLYEHYNDIRNKLFLLYLRPILKDTNHVVKIFQSDNADPTSLLNELTQLISKMCKRITVDTAEYDPLTTNMKDIATTTAYFGYLFEQEFKASNLEKETGEDLRNTCLSFTLDFIDELRSRLPDNVKVLQTMSYFSPATCLSATKNSINQLAETLGYNKL